MTRERCVKRLQKLAAEIVALKITSEPLLEGPDANKLVDAAQFMSRLATKVKNNERKKQ